MVAGDVIYFTSDSFFVKAPLKGGRASSDPRLIQNNWFKCEDSEYKDMSKSWNEH